MPLVSQPVVTPPAAPPFPEPLVPNIAAPEYRTSLVDSRVTPISALLTHIEGSLWITDYYRQAIGADENLTPYQPGQLAVYQQYLVVKNFELKVNTPLAFNQDINSTEFSVSGAATTYPFLIPNPGDCFLADVGDGRTGQFTVDRVTRKTILKETCYEIEYTLSRYLTKDIHQDLMTRVVKTLYFDKDFLLYGQNPVVAEQDYVDKGKIEKLLNLLTTQYLQSFFSTDYQTLLVPGQEGPTYDPHITSAFLRMVDHYKYPTAKRIKELNVDGQSVLKINNLWNSLLNLEQGMLGLGIQKMQLISAKAFSNWPMFESVFFSGLKYVIYPSNAGSTVDTDYKETCQVICDCADSYLEGGLRDLEDMDWDLRTLFLYTYAGGLDCHTDAEANPQPTIPPWIHPVLLDDYYVFSQYFYDEATFGQSQLELQVRKLINGEPLDRFKIFQICDSMVSWGRLEKFYYIPVLIVLLRMSLYTLS